MDVRALVKCDLLALQISDRLDRAVLRHEDRLDLRRRVLVADIEKRYAGSLGKDRRRLAAMGEIDRARLDSFEKRRSGRKLTPGDSVTERPQPLFQIATRFQKPEAADLQMG